MRPHLPISLLLSVTCLYSGVSAESTSVSSWDEISTAITAGNQDMIMGGDITAGSSTLKPGSATVIEGNGHSLIMTPESEGQETKALFDMKDGGALTWKNLSVQGVVNPSSKTGGQRGSLIVMDEPRVAVNMTMDHCTVSGVNVGNNVYNPLFYFKHIRPGSKVNLTNNTFTGNGTTVADISGQIQGEINGCTFERNGSITSLYGGALNVSPQGGKFVVRNTSFIDNYVQGRSMLESKGGAIYAGNYFALESCEFRGNYTLKGEAGEGVGHGKGGAIYLTELDSSMSVEFYLAAKDRDCIFEGNRMGVTSVGSDGKLEGGVANSLYVEDFYNKTRVTTFDIKADEGRSVKFYDPIVVNDVGIGNGDGMGSIHNQYIGVIKLNARDSTSGEHLPTGKGSIVFSGEKYTNDADRMSRLSTGMVMAQDNGSVVITKGACLGANMRTTSIADAKQARIENAGYNLRKGTLSITDNGSLIAGGFMVGVGGVGATENNGWNNCVLSVGSTASLTTGWVRIDQGVSFDLLSFFQGGQMGLQIDLATNYLTFDYVSIWGYEGYEQSKAGRFVLGGTLGLADSLEMYRNEMWQTDQSFLLMDLSQSAAEAYTASGSTNFSEIISNASGKAKVDDKSVYNGTWSQKWVDDGKGGKQLYAVWDADGNTPSIPEPSTATMSLAALALMVFRRRR